MTFFKSSMSRCAAMAAFSVMALAVMFASSPAQAGVAAPSLAGSIKAPAQASSDVQVEKVGYRHFRRYSPYRFKKFRYKRRHFRHKKFYRKRHYRKKYYGRKFYYHHPSRYYYRRHYGYGGFGYYPRRRHHYYY